MLNALLEFAFPLGEAAIYALIGFVFVFLGIVLLIIIFTLLGMVMKRVNERPKRVKEKSVETQEQTAQPLEENNDELVAVITAAIACYMKKSQSKCDFVVKRIKKL